MGGSALTHKFCSSPVRDYILDVYLLFTLTDAGIGVAAGGAALVLLVPRSTAASEADCVGLGVSLTKALSTLGL